MQAIKQALTGKTALVTGANRGLGAAIALDLARRGANLVMAVRDPNGAQALLAEMAGIGTAAIATPCDIAHADDAERAVAAGIARFGCVDILVNNAGQIEPIGRITDTDPAEWEHAVAVNLFGAYRMTRAVLPGFVSRGCGTIVNLSSGAAHTPREGWSAYCSGKAGMAMFMRACAHEYGPAGVRAYGFQPGVVDTDMQVTIRASGMNEISRLKREQLAAPEIPARWVSWLCVEQPEDLAGREFSVNDAEIRARLEGWVAAQ